MTTIYKTTHYTGFSSTGLARFQGHHFVNNLIPKDAKLTMINTDGLLDLISITTQRKRIKSLLNKINIKSQREIIF